MLEIKDMLNSYNDVLVEIGLFLYRRNNGEDGLSPDDTYELVNMINKAANREYEIGYKEGVEDSMSRS